MRAPGITAGAPVVDHLGCGAGGLEGKEGALLAALVKLFVERTQVAVRIGHCGGEGRQTGGAPLESPVNPDPATWEKNHSEGEPLLEVGS